MQQESNNESNEHEGDHRALTEQPNEEIQGSLQLIQDTDRHILTPVSFGTNPTFKKGLRTAQKEKMAGTGRELEASFGLRI